MRLRGALATSLAAAALAILCAVTPGDFQAQEVPSGAATMHSQSPPQDAFAKYQGLIVQQVQLPNITADADQQKLRQWIAQKEGLPLDRDKIRESIHQLYGTGLFSEIRVEAEPAPDNRVSLTFLTSPNYFVGDVRIVGAPRRPTPGQIVNASKLLLGETFTRDRLNRALANIKQFMEANGFYSSTVSAEEDPNSRTQQMAIVFRMNPGPQARVGNVTVKCASTCSPAEVQKAAKLKRRELVTIQSASRALERLRKGYEKRDRLLAQVRIAEKSYQPKTNTVDYTLELNPGPKVAIVAEGFKILRVA